MDRAVLRLLDANANRAAEGLRAAGEYARFVLEDAPLAAAFRELRRALAGAVGRLASPEARAAARDAAGDVLAPRQADAPHARADAAEVALASSARAAEALRTLEEYGRTIDASAAGKIERLRYRLYDLDRALRVDGERARRLRPVRLYVLVTHRFASADTLTAAREALAGGADMIEYREKDMEDGEFLERTRAMCEVCREHGAPLLVNDRADVARAAGADGVHLGTGDLPTREARAILGPRAILGRSTHAPEEARAAVASSADYVAVGPVWETSTKAHRAAVGLEYVRWAAREVEIPWFAIGSVTLDSLDAVIEAGARRVAICKAVIGAKDIAAAAGAFKERLLAAAAAESREEKA